MATEDLKVTVVAGVLTVVRIEGTETDDLKVVSFVPTMTKVFVGDTQDTETKPILV